MQERSVSVPASTTVEPDIIRKVSSDETEALVASVTETVTISAYGAGPSSSSSHQPEPVANFSVIEHTTQADAQLIKAVAIETNLEKNTTRIELDHFDSIAINNLPSCVGEAEAVKQEALPNEDQCTKKDESEINLDTLSVSRSDASEVVLPRSPFISPSEGISETNAPDTPTSVALPIRAEPTFSTSRLMAMLEARRRGCVQEVRSPVTWDPQVRAAQVCAIGIGIALIFIVLRRLLLLFLIPSN
ncbi:unnamed protein product [Protopolystoma xenopodis]|uniref:Uncharacterized protein n=1 Tax=Protopolystoma xenopodis TaxID=117903 RepID=A0A3S5B8Y1_9PLAT|nr:unnamed protein product [Protopolystoma xenopodis]